MATFGCFGRNRSPRRSTFRVLETPFWDFTRFQTLPLGDLHFGVLPIWGSYPLLISDLGIPRNPLCPFWAYWGRKGGRRAQFGAVLKALSGLTVPGVRIPDPEMPLLRHSLETPCWKGCHKVAHREHSSPRTPLPTFWRTRGGGMESHQYRACSTLS